METRYTPSEQKGGTMLINSCNINGLASLSTMIISPTTALALASTTKLDYWGKEIAEVRVNSIFLYSVHFSRSAVSDSATPWTAACWASLSTSQSLLKVVPIESVMPSNHLIPCRPLLFLPSVFPSIRVFSSASVLCIRWPKYWSIQHQSLQWIFSIDFL